ncbi:MAG TPA: SCO family protein [Stellaceae bacterium]|jgi:protein SCO1/2|nr:SCO family protein [Stellaceae bacterium]
MRAVPIDRRTALAVVAALSLLRPARGFAENKFTLLSQPKPVPAFALDDQDGHPFGVARLKGHWTLLFMGYTYCPDICPYTLANLAAVIDAMAKRAPADKVPQVVFLAVDPTRDKPVLKSYIGSFGDRFIGITGSLDAIQTLVDGIGGYVRREPPDNDGQYAVVHTATVSVVDPSARIVATMLPPFQPAETADKLIVLMPR